MKAQKYNLNRKSFCVNKRGDDIEIDDTGWSNL